MARIRRRATALWLLPLICPVASVRAQAPDTATIFAAYDSTTPGCAAAVVEGGRTLFARGYGMASLEHGVRITPATAFYAASVSKQFTAFAVALLAHSGRLSLDDDIRKWLPEVPDFGRTITVRHLIHHTSGLRDYFGLLGMTGWPSDGPITEAQFLDLVSRQKSLNFDPGTRHLYSNTGYVLLSILVKRVTGQSLREYADSAMFRPLGMMNTVFRDNHNMLVKNRALAYAQVRGEWQLNLPGFDVVGDGGMYTTVEDLAKWARQLEQPTIGDANLASLVRTRGRLNSGDSITYAFGITHGTMNGLPILTHGGAYGGYRTDLVHIPQLRATGVVLCNATSAQAAALNRRVLVAVLGDRLPPPPPVTGAATTTPAPAVVLTGPQLTRFPGAYWDAQSEVLRTIQMHTADVASSGAAAGAIAFSGTGAPLVPVAATRFRNATGTVTYDFVLRGDSVLQFEETDAAGQRTVFRRMAAARTDAATFAGYAGEFYSPELDASWHIAVQQTRLVMRRRALPEITLSPVFLDAFFSPAGILRFERDARGNVTGFVVGAGRVTGFRFGKR